MKQKLGEDESSKLSSIGKQLVEGSEHAPRFDQDRIRRMTILAHSMKRRFSQTKKNLVAFEETAVARSTKNSVNGDMLKEPLLSSLSENGSMNINEHKSNNISVGSGYFTNTNVPDVKTSKTILKRNDTA